MNKLSLVFILFFMVQAFSCNGGGTSHPVDGEEDGVEVVEDGLEDIDVRQEDIDVRQEDIDVRQEDIEEEEEVASECGDGVIGPGETCDPPESCPEDCDDGDPCSTDTMSGSAAECNVVCDNAPVTTCDDGDGCCPAGCEPSTDSDCGPLTMPRLFVADSVDETGGGIKVWNNADTIVADRAADASLGGPGIDGLGLALYMNRLFAATGGTEALYIYDDASLLTDGSARTDAIGVSAFDDTSLNKVYSMNVDADANLWIDYNMGDVRLFTNAAALDGASTSRAEFIHPWSQIFAVASDRVGDKLIGGQVSGAGVIVWDDPLSFSGEDNESDWQLHGPIGAAAMLIDGGRLYLAQYNSPCVNIWDNIASVTAAAAPDVTMTEASGMTHAQHVSVRNDVMVVTVSEHPDYKVNIYLNASGITGDRLPDFEVTDVLMTLPEKAFLDQNDTLYVIDRSGVLIFADATSAPALQVKLEMGLDSPEMLLVMECSPFHPCAGGEPCRSGLCMP